MIRMYTLSEQFTHIDDVMVVSNIIDPNRVERINQAIQAGKDSSIGDDLNSGLYRTLKNAHPHFYYGIIYNYFKISSRFTYLSKISTYAPLQNGLTSFIVPSNDFSDYEKIKWKGRFFSCLFGCLSIALLVFFLRKNLEFKWIEICLPLALLVYSWEHIIYSQQMEPYTIAVFAHLIILYWITRDNFQHTYQSLAILGILLGILSWGQYQLIFCSFALYASLTVTRLTDSQQWKRIILSGCIYLMVTFELWDFLISRSDGGVNWNSGLSNQFLFSWKFLLSGRLVDFIVYFFQFFSNNFWITFKAIIGFTEDEHSTVLICTAAFLLFLLGSGVYCLHTKRRQEKFQRIYVYFICFHAVWFLLILSGKITFSPTRHSLILLPVWLVFISLGIPFWITKLKRFGNETIILVVCILSLFFFLDYSSMIYRRKDPVTENEFRSICQTHQPDLIFQYGFTENVLLFSFRDSLSIYTSHMPSLEINKIRHSKFHQETKTPTTILFFSTKNKLSESILSDSGNRLSIDTSAYEMTYKVEREIAVEVEYSYQTRNGINGFYLYILKKKKPN